MKIPLAGHKNYFITFTRVGPVNKTLDSEIIMQLWEGSIAEGCSVYVIIVLSFFFFATPLGSEWSDNKRDAFKEGVLIFFCVGKNTHRVTHNRNCIWKQTTIPFTFCDLSSPQYTRSVRRYVLFARLFDSGKGREGMGVICLDPYHSGPALVHSFDTETARRLKCHSSGRIYERNLLGKLRVARGWTDRKGNEWMRRIKIPLRLPPPPTHTYTRFCLSRDAYPFASTVKVQDAATTVSFSFILACSVFAFTTLRLSLPPLRSSSWRSNSKVLWGMTFCSVENAPKRCPNHIKWHAETGGRKTSYLLGRCASVGFRVGAVWFVSCFISQDDCRRGSVWLRRTWNCCPVCDNAPQKG